MVKKKYQICFSHKYNKLDKDKFTTVRWLDAEYKLGGAYEVFLVADNMFHTKYGKGKVRVMKMEIEKLRELSETFIKADADCNRDTFYKMMEKWYSKKPDWKGWDSEIQILYRKELHYRIISFEIP